MVAGTAPELESLHCSSWPVIVTVPEVTCTRRRHRRRRGGVSWWWSSAMVVVIEVVVVVVLVVVVVVCSSDRSANFAAPVEGDRMP